MKAIFYKSTEPPNKLNKTLVDGVEAEVNLLDEGSILNLSMELNVTEIDFSEYNYLYIPIFDRYYFIDNRYYHYNGIIRIDCNEDFLNSHKADILKCNGIVNGVDSNKYVDEGFSHEVRETVYKQEIPLKMGNKKIVLICSGTSGE